MKKKVLMLYPEYPVTFWSFKHVLKYISKKAAFPPLGLLTVAAMLPQDWEIRVIDLNTDQAEKKDYDWADYVMISAMIIQKKSVCEILDKCRQYGKKVIAGGPLFNIVPEDYSASIDHLVLGEAESSLPPLLADLEKGCPRRVYASDQFPALTTTPLPRWDLIDVGKYASLTVQFSRGCPHDCEFCDITALYGRTPRLKGQDQFIRELQAAYDTGWRGTVFVVDDNFIGNKREVKKTLPKVIDWMKLRNYPFDFMTETTITLADDDELIRLMAEAGFDNVFIGFETPEEASLKECSKNHNCRRDMVASVKKLQNAGIQVMGGYIVGFDHDDESIFSKQIKFIQDSGVVTAMVSLLSVVPKTRLWQRLKNENRLDEDLIKENGTCDLNFTPVMNRAALLEGYREVVRTIYSPGPYYQRICKFLENYRPNRTRKIKVDFTRIKALIRSVFLNGFLGNGITQWHYWKMLIKLLVRYRDAFPDAMSLMILGIHFRKIIRNM